jgi:hypothetical protein
MTYQQWVNAVLALGRERGYIMTAEQYVERSTGRIGHVIYGAADACGLYFTGTSVEGIERYVTPEQFFYAQPCMQTVTLQRQQQILAGDSTEWARRGRYVPRIPARAVSMAMEALFG